MRPARNSVPHKLGRHSDSLLESMLIFIYSDHEPVYRMLEVVGGGHEVTALERSEPS